MRKRNYVVAGLLGVIGSLVIAAPAWAPPVSPHGFQVSGNPPKQSKKQFGGVSVNAAVDETFVGGFFPPAVRSQFFLPNEWKITGGRLANTPCSTGQISTATFSTARSICSSSLVGTGNVVIRTLAGTALFGQVSAFVGGQRLLLIHIDVPQVPSKPVLQGNLVGNSTLDVQLQPVAGTVIDDINLNVPKKKVSKKGAKKRKFFIGAKCTDGTWSSTQLTTFQDGSTSAGTPVTQRCQKRK